MDYVDLGRRIRIQRELLKLTQGELAKRISVSASFIGHLERGTRKASMETLVALANELDVPVDYLLAGSLRRSALQHITPGQKNQRQDAMMEAIALLQAQMIDRS